MTRFTTRIQLMEYTRINVAIVKVHCHVQDTKWKLIARLLEIA